jgi:putative membrane protein
MADTGETFQIQRPQVGRYFYWGAILGTAAMGALIFGFGALAALVYAWTFGPWLSRKQAAVLEYRLCDTHLFVHQGVFFVKRKSIPLDRITDIVLTQGPLLRYFGIWRLDIQTAGSGQQRAEAYLYGLVDPEQIKEKILTARDAISIGGKNPGF